MTASSLTVRPMATETDFERHFMASREEFSPDAPIEAARQYQESVMTRPGYRPQSLRGAYQGEQHAGGYILFEWVMRMGAARIPTGCIGSVVTYQNYRKLGVGMAMLQDATAYARSNGYPLLLLDGIPEFYHRFGYTRVFDVTIHDIDRGAILALPASGDYQIRRATLEDAPVLLALYERGFGEYMGSFARSVEVQKHMLKQSALRENLPWLALNQAGEAVGSLHLRAGEHIATSWEMTADSWPAALALFQHHARLVEGPNAPATLRYHFAPDAPIIQAASDHLKVVDTSHWGNPVLEGSVISHTFRHPNTGWMATISDVPMLLRAMLPELQARWRRSLIRWSGNVTLDIDGERHTLALAGPDLRLLEQPASASEVVNISRPRFTQAVFGYRPVAGVSGDVQTILDTLFPQNHTWIPVSDWF